MMMIIIIIMIMIMRINLIFMIIFIFPFILFATESKPWNQEMCSLIHNLFLHTRQSIEDYGSSATLNIVDGCLGERSSDGERDGVLVQRLECLSHLDGCIVDCELS